MASQVFKQLNIDSEANQSEKTVAALDALVDELVDMHLNMSSHEKMAYCVDLAVSDLVDFARWLIPLGARYIEEKILEYIKTHKVTD